MAMFFQGSVQEGISSAVGQQKLVLCFVTDEQDESQIWETEYLQDDSIKKLIQSQAVALRLKAGSDEAGYLSQIFPLPKSPTVVIMKHGELKEYISSQTTKEDFFRRVQNAFNASSASASATSSTAAPTPSTTTDNTPAPVSSTTSPLSAQSNTSENVQRILAERSARLQASKAEAERKAKEERIKAQERAKADAEVGVDNDATRAHKQAEMVKQRRQKETGERRRILKRIEDDKEERKRIAAERERKRIESQTVGDVASALVQSPGSKFPSTTKLSEMTSIQVRLLDGTTIRTRFKTAAPVADIRQWVDKERSDGKLPYKFKQVLTPLPNKSIDDAEENKSIGDVGLAPSSTLVLIPVNNFSSAYESGSQNIFSKLIGLAMGFFAWLLTLIGIGSRGSLEHSAPQNDTQATTIRDPAVRQRQNRAKEASQDRKHDHQLYNGNSLNFEPRPDNEDD